MKIISPFHDYYDVGLANNSNDNIIFIRKPLEYKIADYSYRSGNKTTIPEIVDTLYKEYKSYILPKLYGFRGDNNTPNVSWVYTNQYRYGYDSINIDCKKDGNRFTIVQEKYLIVFCGKIYPVLSMLNMSNSQKNFIYDYDSWYNYCAEYKIDLQDNKFYNNVREYFNNTNIKVDIDYLISNKITIAIIANGKVLFNNRLSDYQFYKVFDHYTAFQELDMWLSGTLSYPQNLMIEVSNESKIEKHGFDLKYGFRKRSTKNEK